MWRDVAVVAAACSVLLGVLGCVGDAAPSPTATSPTAGAEPGLGWASFIRDDCEWSAPATPAVCFGSRGPGFQVRAIRRDGARWYVWDPSTRNFAYVDRAALSLPVELTRDEPPRPAAAKTAVICVDRSRTYRSTGAAQAAIGAWIVNDAQPGDVFYLRWIEDDSYRPEAEAIPVVRVAPALTPASLAATPGPPNPFDVREVAQATATVRAISDEQTAAAATQAAARQAASEATSRAIGAFLKREPAPAASADVSGCVRKAAELLADTGTDRYLIVATSASGGVPTADGAAGGLERVQMRLVFFQCDDADSCERAKAGWSAFAAQANAANLRVSDPSQGLGRIEP